MQKLELTVGQEVILRHVSSYWADGERVRKIDDKPATITKIGRKYAYVMLHGRETPFDRESGREKTDFSAEWFIGTAESFAEYEKRRELVDRVSAEFRKIGRSAKLSTEALEKIVEILNQDEADA